MVFIEGAIRRYQEVKTEDAQINFQAYGDITICDADNNSACQFINPEPEAKKECDS